MHSPIWSAHDGHHLPIQIPDRFDKSQPNQSYIFKPWGHLLQSRVETLRDITKRFDKIFAEEVIYNTYNNSHINRYFSEDYFACFENSDFTVSEYQITFLDQINVVTQERLEKKHPGYKEFSNNGIYAILQKPTAQKHKKEIITF